MLVLSRRQGEKISIGDQITITVVAAQDGRVKIGLEAPKDIHIVRGELLDRSKSDQRSESELELACLG